MACLHRFQPGRPGYPLFLLTRYFFWKFIDTQGEIPYSCTCSRNIFSAMD